MSGKVATLLLLLFAGPLRAQQPDSAGRPPRSESPDSALRAEVARAPVRAAPAADAGARAAAPVASAKYLYLHPELDYGSAVIRSPLDVWFNRGLSVVAFDGKERALGRIKWHEGWLSVRDAVTHLRRAVRRAGGTETWLQVQLLPSGARVWQWAFAPNYSGHIVAGGITYRFVTEWFDERGVPAPWLAAMLVNAVTSTTNEMVESQRGPPGSAATAADLLIFDQLSVLVFSFNAPARFFAHQLQAADWSPQASIAFPGARVLNSSQILSYKVPLPWVDRLGLLVLIGQSAGIGFRERMDDGYHVSATVGFETTNRMVDPITGDEGIRVDWGGGIYLDRNNSLLVSLVDSPRAYSGMQLNLYPGVLPGALRPAGVWTSRSRRGDWSLGLAFQRTLGLGLATEFAH